MDQLTQLALLKQLSQLTPSQMSQLTPQQVRQINELASLTQATQQQAQQQNQQKQQQQELLRLQQQQLKQQQLKEQQLKEQAQREQAQREQQLKEQAEQVQNHANIQLLQQQQLSVNLASGFPPTLVSLNNHANLYAYGYVQGPLSSNVNGPTTTAGKYEQLLAVIDEMGKDIRPIYSGSKTGAERFKRLIAQARSLIRECLLETERHVR